MVVLVVVRRPVLVNDVADGFADGACRPRVLCRSKWLMAQAKSGLLLLRIARQS